VVWVTSLTVTAPETVDAKELESEIVTALVDRLRDDHGYELVAGPGPVAPKPETSTLCIRPAASSLIRNRAR